MIAKHVKVLSQKITIAHHMHLQFSSGATISFQTCHFHSATVANSYVKFETILTVDSALQLPNCHFG